MFEDVLGAFLEVFWGCLGSVVGVFWECFSPPFRLGLLDFEEKSGLLLLLLLLLLSNPQMSFRVRGFWVPPPWSTIVQAETITGTRSMS